MINVVVNKSRGESADAATLTFSGGPAVAGRVHLMRIYVAPLNNPGAWAEITPFELVPAGGETDGQAAAAFDGFINAYPRYESTVSGGLLSIEPKDRNNYIEVEYLIDGERVPGSYVPAQPEPVVVNTSERSVFVDDAALAAREAEVPDAEWNSGMLGGGSAGPGIGISTQNPGLDESLFPATDGSGDLVVGSWTLEDQHGNARAFQLGQNIGGSGYTDPADYPSSGGEEGTLPESTIRLQSEDDLPTNEEKADGTRLDGSLVLPADGALLDDLATGWTGAATPP